VSRPSPVVPVTPATLPTIRDRGVPVPAYDRTALRPRIVHVGVGGFHRAHMALYTDEVAARGSDWGIRGLGLRPEDAAMAGALSAQDRLYTLTEKSTGSHAPRVVGSIVDYVHAPSAQEAVASAIVDPDVAIVSLTITESGYADRAPAGANPTFDRLVAALDARRLGGLAPVTVLSCDNLPGNGDVARNAMLAAAARRSSALAAWIHTACTFPNSMVDRITPATTDADRAWLLANLGIDDRWPVVAEPFRQWVIEDRFVASRPPWEDAGAIFTDDVRHWELYKLRMLNAAHSCMAYLCSLAGIAFVDEAMAHDEVRHYLTALLHTEALPTLTPIPDHPREDYIASVLQRFSNTGVRDQIARLCIDGAAKYPTFLMPTIERQLELGGPVRRSALALAGWARYLADTPLDRQSFDAGGGHARECAVAARHDPARFLELVEVFPAAVRTSERFRDELASATRLLDERGPLGAMAL
jgi:mannitol 2-dehydrogenase